MYLTLSNTREAFAKIVTTRAAVRYFDNSHYIVTSPIGTPSSLSWIYQTLVLIWHLPPHPLLSKPPAACITARGRQQNQTNRQVRQVCAQLRHDCDPGYPHHTTMGGTVYDKWLLNCCLCLIRVRRYISTTTQYSPWVHPTHICWLSDNRS